MQVLYAVGTGINLQHPTFEGRAVWGFDAVSQSDGSVGDHHGLTTYVAGKEPITALVHQLFVKIIV